MLDLICVIFYICVDIRIKLFYYYSMEMFYKLFISIIEGICNVLYWYGERLRLL